MSTPAERIDVVFRSGDARCAGWLYPSDSAEAPAPCVVMGHGFGALKEGRLAPYAERFQRNGFAVLAFDYRHFGTSAGQPRQLLNIRSQLDDWAAATGYARALECVDADRIVVWGSSFGGGHVIRVAARDPRIVAAIAQVPHASGPASARAAGASANLRMAAAGIRDTFGALLRRPPYYAPIVGSPGTLGAMTSPDALAGYCAMYPEGFSWRNEVAPRVLLATAMYSPGRAAAQVRCLLLVQVASRDVVTPPEPARRAARRAVRGELVRYPIGHFDIYVGEPFERAVADQLSFLNRHVGVAAS
jgi:hypothetical protein